MPIKDYSKEFHINNNKTNSHAIYLPKNIFCVVAGATGSGKTNLILNFLLNEGVLNYRDVYIYSSTLYQPAYVFLEEYYHKMEKLFKSKTGTDFKVVYFYDADREIKNPSELDKNVNHIMIFIKL